MMRIKRISCRRRWKHFYVVVDFNFHVLEVTKNILRVILSSNSYDYDSVSHTSYIDISTGSVINKIPSS